tara:strand:+ start:150 stop:599 length:450 start_codon:yes stop_codon:yes gene_type:complete
MKAIKIIILTLLSLALPLLDIITFRHTCDFKGDMGPEFYGLPFIYRTEIPWVNSFNGDFYILGYFGNVLFFGIILAILALVISKLKLNDKAKKVRDTTWIGVSALLIFFAGLFFFVTEWRFNWTTAEMEEYMDQSTNCSRTLDFISTGE